MTRIYNTIGSLTTLQSLLEENRIYDFKSLEQIIDFRNSYFTSCKQILSHHTDLIEEERIVLGAELKNLEAEIEKNQLEVELSLTGENEEIEKQIDSSVSQTSVNLFQNITGKLKLWNFTRKFKNKENQFDFRIRIKMFHLLETFQKKKKHLNFINSHLDEAVKQGASNALYELDRKKTVIDNLSSLIYGALGEQKVVRELENLPDEYILINDFSISISPPIYFRQEDDYIMSVQIDHVLVSPAGVFLIETKNWSKKSLENLSLRSPVDQIRRTSFVLFLLLNNEMDDYHLQLDIHHWGDKKVPIKNLIVMINTKPQEEFKYVKVLSLSQLPGYIRYFKPIFSNEDTQRIADFLLRINDSKAI